MSTPEKPELHLPHLDLILVEGGNFLMGSAANGARQGHGAGEGK